MNWKKKGMKCIQVKEMNWKEWNVIELSNIDWIF